jgi:hypothetical protein
MDRTHQHPVKTRALLGLVGLVTLLALLFASTQAAQASEAPYCGGTLGPKGQCTGSARWFNGQYGTGAQGSVCIFNAGHGTQCSTNTPGSGTYFAMGSVVWLSPGISNNMLCCNNLVHGTTFAP